MAEELEQCSDNPMDTIKTIINYTEGRDCYMCQRVRRMCLEQVERQLLTKKETQWE